MKVSAFELQREYELEGGQLPQRKPVAPVDVSRPAYDSMTSAMQDDRIAWRYWLDKLDCRASKRDDCINAVKVDDAQLAKFHSTVVTHFDELAWQYGLLTYCLYRVYLQNKVHPVDAYWYALQAQL